VAAALKAYKQKLQAYEQSLAEALRQEWPLSEAKRQQFQKQQQQMELSEADVAAITARVTADAQAYHHHVQQYEEAFAKAARQEYPLGEVRLRELRQYRESLSLAEVDVAPIEAKITAETQTHHQKSQQYEQAYSDATQRKYYPNETSRQQLQKTWQTLGLHEADVNAIEYRLNSEIQTHQDHLNQYKQDFIKAVQQHYPLDEAARLPNVNYFLTSVTITC
jgi:hypothetical protein